MPSHFRTVIWTLVGIGVLMISILGFHLGGDALLPIGHFFPLLGALIGGTLALVSVNIPFRREENAEPWFGRERSGWVLIGCGFIGWSIGESLWRYYVAQGQSPFPSLADLGYSSCDPLIFLGLLLQPFSKSGNRRMFLLLDSLIAMGALLAIAWFLLLGSLAQTPAESLLGKFLGLYYPSSDVVLLSCVIFLLIRGQDRLTRAKARRLSLLVFGLGLSVYASADFLFNVLSNMGLPVDGTWIDLGWPLGIMMMGVAAYLRRFLPATAESVVEEHMERYARQGFRPSQALPYVLLGFLFLVLAFNVLSSDKTQQSIRSVLLIATLLVVVLVVVRQIITMLQNEHLLLEQGTMLTQLEKVRQDIAKRNAELEEGVTHLKEVQTRLANGDVRARARIMSGDLWPLASGLNLMADRMMRSETSQRYAQQVIKALDDLSIALEHSRQGGNPFVLPLFCREVPAIQRLLLVLGLRPVSGVPPHPAPSRPVDSPLTSFSAPSAPSSPSRPSSASTEPQWKTSSSRGH